MTVARDDIQKHCVLRAYFSALTLNRLQYSAARAAGKALMLPPRRVSENVKGWRKHGNVRPPGGAAFNGG